MAKSTKETKKGSKKIQMKMKVNIWKIFLVVFIVIFFIPFVVSLFELQKTESEVETSQAIRDIKDGMVEEVSVQDNKIILNYDDETTKTTTKESNESFADLLEKEGIKPSEVNYTIVDQSVTKAIGEVLGILLPVLLMAGFFFFIFRSQNKGAQDIFSFGRSKAKLFAKGKQDITFNDVAGVTEAKRPDIQAGAEKTWPIGAQNPKSCYAQTTL